MRRRPITPFVAIGFYSRACQLLAEQIGRDMQMGRELADARFLGRESAITATESNRIVDGPVPSLAARNSQSAEIPE